MFQLQKLNADSDDSLNMLEIESKPTVGFEYINAFHYINLNMSRYLNFRKDI